jgi:hypothetical protein
VLDGTNHYLLYCCQHNGMDSHEHNIKTLASRYTVWAITAHSRYTVWAITAHSCYTVWAITAHSRYTVWAITAP